MFVSANIVDVARAITPGGGSGPVLAIGFVMVFIGLLMLSFVRDETTLDATNEIPAEEQHSALRFFLVITLLLVLWTSVGAAWVVASFSTLVRSQQEKQARELEGVRPSGRSGGGTNEGLSPTQRLLMGQAMNPATRQEAER